MSGKVLEFAFAKLWEAGFVMGRIKKREKLRKIGKLQDMPKASPSAYVDASTTLVYYCPKYIIYLLDFVFHEGYTGSEDFDFFCNKTTSYQNGKLLAKRINDAYVYITSPKGTKKNTTSCVRLISILHFFLVYLNAKAR